MNCFSTSEVAEKMLESGKRYTSATLGKELGISSKAASAKLFNIRESKKYKCEISSLPNRTVKVISIHGKSIAKSTLWNLAIFKKAIATEVTL